MKAYLTSIGFALVLLMSGFHQAYAGSQQHGKPTFTPEAIATFSKDVEKIAFSKITIISIIYRLRIIHFFHFYKKLKDFIFHLLFWIYLFGLFV